MKVHKISRFGWLGLLLAFGSAALLGSVAQGAISSLAVVAGAGRGVHLGNVSGGEGWHEAYFSRIRGEGNWPDTVVFMSNQVYDVKRAPAPDCRITGEVSILNEAVWQYLQEASAAGVRIVIRIYPSQGYFNKDGYIVPGVVPNHCDWSTRRSIDDIGDEICAIYEFNQENNLANKWVSFLPANEPNLEWYADKEHHPDPDPYYNVNQHQAWEEMDTYFTAIYDYVKGKCNAQVLTPPMAQNQFAEGYKVNHKVCDPQPLDNGKSGYQMMENVFMNGVANDGYAWNNYWSQGDEGWSHCWYEDADFNGQHVAVYFPPTMQARVAAKDSLITEADLASPTQAFGNPLEDKDQNDGLDAAKSLTAFYCSETARGNRATKSSKRVGQA